MSIPKIKLNNGSQIYNALNGNNISLGFDEIVYQESSISGWYMGIQNPEYTIYSRSLVNPVQPNIWATSGTSDLEILNFINRTTNVGNTPFTSTTEAFYYVGTKAENFIIKGDYPNISLSELVLNYDTGMIMGYPWSGNTVYDLSPSQNNATLSGSPSFSPSYDGIIDFNGSGQYAYGSDIGQLSAFTINTWFRLDSLPSSTEFPAIATEKFVSNNLGWCIGFANSPQDGKIVGGYYNNGWVLTSGFTPTTNTWYNVTLTYDNTALKLYIDGVLFSSVNSTTDAISSGLGFNVGKRWDDDDFIDGQVQVVQVYNKALSGLEISNGYTEYVNRYSSPGVSPTPTPTNTTTPTTTQTSSPTPTPTNTTTPTTTPTNTATPSYTPSPTPTVAELINPILVGLDEYLNVGADEYLMFVESIPAPSPTPTATPTNTVTPTIASSSTPTPTNTVTPTVTETPTTTPTNTNTPTPSTTETPTVTPTVTSSETPTNTPTPTETPTNTPTPSVTPEPVTGYSFNLIQLPYNFPTSGNTILNNAGAIQSGSTNPNVLNTTQRGLYWSSIDSGGIDRTSYFSQFTGQSVTITMSQTGSTAIYSGDTSSLKFWTGNTGTPPGVPGTGFVFGTSIQLPGLTAGTGNAVIIQSASTEWNFGIPVYISVVINGSITPTPTPTNTSTPTPTNTPTSSVSPTPSVTETSTNTPTPTPTVTPTPTETPIPSSGFTATIYESGSDVIWEGSGSFDLTDLTFDSTNSIGPGYNAGNAIWIVGPNTPSFGDYYDGVTTFPASIGSGGVAPDDGSGDIFGILPSINRILVVPTGYTSNTFISGSTTYLGQTISSMGLTPGTYTWSWGSGGTASSLVMTIN